MTEGARAGKVETFLFDDVAVDPEVKKLIDLEDRRQAEKLQMIPSESICPRPVLAALATSFSNKYAEGYPSLRLSRKERHRVGETERYLAFHRRYGDRRFYKGTEIVDLIEALAEQRCAELFATPEVPVGDIFVNVQPLSGAPANNAVYEALCKPFDTVMGMHLSYGGHLTHGSPFNRSGKYHKVHAYAVSPETGKLDYDAIRHQAIEVKPRLLIAGASAYPWTIDWKRLAEIAKDAGAYLLADISHPAGLVAAGLFPTPVGVADVTMFTTHKTLCGPRGAVLVATDREIAKKIDSAVFPGEQGGPHANSIAAKAVCFGLAKTEKFRELQHRIVENAAALAEGFRKRGLPLAYGGTDTHLCLIDLRAMEWPAGVTLTADVASNILDLCGITANKNALPGDETGVRPSGVRFGSVVLSQRGMGPKEMDTIADLVHRVLRGIDPFRVRGLAGKIVRGKIEYGLLCDIRDEVAKLTAAFPPHPARVEPKGTFAIRGERARIFLNQCAAANVAALKPNQSVRTAFYSHDGRHLADATVAATKDGYVIDGTPRLRDWLSSLSDGYVKIHPEDRHAKVHGPVTIVDSPAPTGTPSEARPDLSKVFFVGRQGADVLRAPERKVFEWKPVEGPEKKTPLWPIHKKLGARLLPFGGYSMPGWYQGTQEEHRAIRTAAGLFDVAHMGTLEVSGPDAADFLDVVTTNFVHRLEAGQSHYTYSLDIDGRVLDDLIIYRTGVDVFLVVVNASNQDKIWAWWNAVNKREVLIDREAPEKNAPGPVTIRQLKNPKEGNDQRIDLAFQGRAALLLLQKFIKNRVERRAVAELGKFEHTPVTLAGISLIVSRTGYTGEEIGYELFVHPKYAEELWNLLLAEGEGLGVLPCGLAARDSTRTEAGFPLYGHELAGPWELGPNEAGYGGFVKRHKPFFIGKRGLVAREETQTREVVRFQMTAKNIKMVRPGDPVVDKKGECVGSVTSCVLVDRTQVGMAYVDAPHAAPGTPLGVFIRPHRDRDAPEKSRSQLQIGDRVSLHEDAVVLPRFPTFGARIS